MIPVEEAREAEICYMGAQIDPSLRKSEGIKESCVVNQFPFEASLVMKHHLPQTVLQVNLMDSPECNHHLAFFFKQLEAGTL